MPHGGRRSLRSETALQGTGLHSGHPCAVCLRPAPAGAGVVFVRVDLPNRPTIPATLESVATTDRRTALSRDGADVETVEHLLAALHAHDVDDCLVEIDGPEIPILDGSAGPYFEAIAQAGTIARTMPRTSYWMPEEVWIRHGDSEYHLTPTTARRLTVAVEWDHPLIGYQRGSYEVSTGVFGTELAGARTFGFAHELELLRRKGLIRGATLGSGVLLSRTGVIGGALRWPDEFVRHKAVDVLGDLALLGGPFVGEITALRPSHRGNLALTRAIAERGERRK